MKTEILLKEIQNERLARKRIMKDSFYLTDEVGREIRHTINMTDIKRKEAIKNLIQKIYTYSPVGGALHIVLDDGNVNDESIVWCLRNSIPKEKDFLVRFDYARCANLLLRLSYSSRKKLIYNLSR